MSRGCAISAAVIAAAAFVFVTVGSWLGSDVDVDGRLDRIDREVQRAVPPDWRLTDRFRERCPDGAPPSITRIYDVPAATSATAFADLAAIARLRGWTTTLHPAGMEMPALVGDRAFEGWAGHLFVTTRSSDGRILVREELDLWCGAGID